MHKLESVVKNETGKILWGFEIEMNHLMKARRPDKALVNKIRDLAVL